MPRRLLIIIKSFVCILAWNLVSLISQATRSRILLPSTPSSSAFLPPPRQDIRIKDKQEAYLLHRVRCRATDEKVPCPRENSRANVHWRHRQLMQPAASVDRDRCTSVHFRLRDLAGTPTPRRSGESQLIRRRGARRITSSRNYSRSAFRFLERINRSIRDREIARSYQDHVDRTRQPHAFPLEIDKSLSMARLMARR